MQTPVFDQFSDSSFRQLNRLIQEYPQTEGSIKTASLDDAENAQRADTAFAWPEARLFPIDSPGQAALSRLYMEKQASVPAHVVAKCEKALDLYGVKMDFSREKTAAEPESNYLLPKVRRLRVMCAEHVKLAADSLQVNKKNLSSEDRAQASVNLVKKAVEMGVRLPPAILKMAGVTACDTYELRDWLYARAEATLDPTIRYGYQKIAEETKRFPQYVNDRDELVKVAAAIKELDDAADLSKHYDKRLPDPMDTVFNTDKISEDMVDLANRQVSLDKLLSIAPEVYKDVFGEDLAAEFIDGDDIDADKLRIILPTVPLDLQKVLARQLGI